MLNIVIYKNLCKHVHSITNGKQNMSIPSQMSKSNPFWTSGKHVNSIANVKMKFIANIFLCKRMCNVSGLFLHYFTMNIFMSNLCTIQWQMSKSNRSQIYLYVTIPITYLFFVFLSLHSFFSYLKCLLWTFSCHIDLLYPIFMFKKLVFIY